MVIQTTGGHADLFWECTVYLFAQPPHAQPQLSPPLRAHESATHHAPRTFSSVSSELAPRLGGKDDWEILNATQRRAHN